MLESKELTEESLHKVSPTRPDWFFLAFSWAREARIKPAPLGEAWGEGEIDSDASEGLLDKPPKEENITPTHAWYNHYRIW